MGIVRSALDIFFIYKFLRILTTPFEKTEAFKLGIIDKDGKILRKRKTLPKKEKKHYSMLHRLVWKLKRIMGKIPFGKSRIASYAAALWFIKENENFRDCEKKLLEYFNEDPNLFLENFEEKTLIKSGYYRLKEDVYDLDDELLEKSGEIIKIDPETYIPILGCTIYEGININGQKVPVSEEIIELVEEAPVNTVGGGNISGVNNPPKFAGSIVFRVKPQHYYNCMQGKEKNKWFQTYVGKEPVLDEIRDYSRKNPKKSIIVQNERTGEMVYLKKV